MKALWDSVGTEFGGRHELYERNYSGNHEGVKPSCSSPPRPRARPAR
jgi:aromatic ring hydroxylase